MNHGSHGGDDTGEAGRFWEEHYREHERVSARRANDVLVDVAGSLPPGTALDLGCGEGGDAIWLARQGWRVTAVDVSATALGRAANHAAEAGVADRIDFQRHDLTRTFPAGAFDLVSAQYTHMPVESPHVLRIAARAVEPGGLLLVADHGSASPWSWADPDTHFPTPEEVLAALELNTETWWPERLASPERREEGPNGQTATVTDIVVAVRRLVRQ